MRGNFWRFADHDGDGNLDLLIGSDDWTDYGWDDNYDTAGFSVVLIDYDATSLALSDDGFYVTLGGDFA